MNDLAANHPSRYQIAWFAFFVTALVGCGKDSLDRTTLCPGAGPESTTVLILDLSDPLEPHQQQALLQFTTSLTTAVDGVDDDGSIHQSENYVPPGHLLVLYELSSENDLPVERFRMCNPGSPDERTILDRFTEGEVVTRVRWAQFQNAISDALPKHEAVSTRQTSPIVEAIRYVRNTEFPPMSELRSTAQTNRYILYVVSDLLQNSPLLSHYRTLPVTKDLPQSLALDLTGVNIGVRYLRNPAYSAYQTPEHFAWWRSFLSEAGGPMNLTPESW